MLHRPCVACSISSAAWLRVLLLFVVLSALAVGAVLAAAIAGFVMLLALGGVIAMNAFTMALLPSLCAVVTCHAS